MDLRSYQVAAIDKAREQIRTGKKRVLLVLPTGGGKTVVAAEIIRSACAKGSRILFLAHRRELISQTCDKLNRFGVVHGVIQAGMPMALHRPVQVASVQTLIRRPEVLNRIDLTFVDEAHHVTDGNTYAELLKRFPTSPVVGLTATPWRLDGHGLADVFDGHVIAATPRQLRDEGWLVPVGGWEYEGIDTSSARVQRGDYVQADLRAEAMSRRVVGDVVKEWLTHAAGRRTVLFATSIAHSQLMVEEFVKAGVVAEHVDGEMNSSERDAILARLRSGWTTIVCNCNVLTEGFDCPELEVVILARPTLSTSLYLQMVGRGLRPAPGKAMCRIHDHAGCLAAHGHPYAERDYSPEHSSKGQRKADTDAAAVQRRCKACKSFIARWPCDSCGYMPEKAELQIEMEPAAMKREIQADGVAPKKQKPSSYEFAAQWKRDFAGDAEKKHWFFLRMVRKHGVEKGCRVYRWFTGGTEWPPPEWREAAEREAATA